MIHTFLYYKFNYNQPHTLSTPIYVLFSLALALKLHTGYNDSVIKRNEKGSFRIKNVRMPSHTARTTRQSGRKRCYSCALKETRSAIVVCVCVCVRASNDEPKSGRVPFLQFHVFNPCTTFELLAHESQRAHSNKNNS